LLECCLHRQRSEWKQALCTFNSSPASEYCKGRLPILTAVPRKKLVPLMNDVNSALATIQIMSIEQINQLAYSAAVIVTEELGSPHN
ncbi:hypothetical protein JRQ81_005928, partial [Phrynocephalus forsythii]